MSLDCRTDATLPAPVVVLHGELDLAAVGDLDRALEGVLPGRPERVVLDLRGLEFIDSCGLRAILLADAKARREGWRLELVAPAPAVRRVFEVAGLDTRLAFVEPASGQVSDARA